MQNQYRTTSNNTQNGLNLKKLVLSRPVQWMSKSPAAVQKEISLLKTICLLHISPKPFLLIWHSRNFCFFFLNILERTYGLKCVPRICPLVCCFWILRLFFCYLNSKALGPFWAWNPIPEGALRPSLALEPNLEALVLAWPFQPITRAPGTQSPLPRKSVMRYILCDDITRRCFEW